VTQRAIGVIANLVARDEAHHYRALVEALPAEKEWQLLVSGPRAPYSFCTLGDTGGGGMLLAT
jgi:hypothetical protein